MSSPSSTRRRFPVRHPVVVVADVGCICRRPKLPFLSSMSKHCRNPQTPSSPLSPSATTSNTSLCDTTTTTTTSCIGDTNSEPDSPKKSSRKKKVTTEEKKKKKVVKRTKVVEESEAVVKESSDPYVDFRESMLDMVAEKEIYAWEDLRDLLNRFLDLNSPYHHHLILRAFAEIISLLFSPPARTAGVAVGEEEGGASGGKVTSPWR